LTSIARRIQFSCASSQNLLQVWRWSVQGKTQEHWRELCAQAAVEQDAEKLLELTKEIIRLLDEKEARLKQGSRTANLTSN